LPLQAGESKEIFLKSYSPHKNHCAGIHEHFTGFIHQTAELFSCIGIFKILLQNICKNILGTD
jgi:predicted DNA-binding helix-hairpin-helix protein